MSDPQEAATPPRRLDPALKADLIDFARERIQMVWNDVPGGVDAATLASNVVAAQEFLWLSLQFPVAATPSDPHSAELVATLRREAALWDAEGPTPQMLLTAAEALEARDAEVAELKAKIAAAWDEGYAARVAWDSYSLRYVIDSASNPYRSASSPVEGDLAVSESQGSST